jgi:hypothetical protein
MSAISTHKCIILQKSPFSIRLMGKLICGCHNLVNGDLQNRVGKTQFFKNMDGSKTIAKLTLNVW